MFGPNVNTRFSKAPQMDIERSVFDRVNTHKTTFNAGKLIPLYYEDVLPGDTVSMDTSFLVRMTTPVFPVMDNAFIDLFWFFVPNRLVWDDWKAFMGENDVNAWASTVNYEVPGFCSDEEGFGFQRGDLGDYFGLPTNVLIREQDSVNQLPFRAYQLIWNEFFRDQNLQAPILINKDSGNRFFITQSDVPQLLPVNKIHDYFTSALPAPQKGAPVMIGFEDVPVFSGSVLNTADKYKTYGLKFGHLSANVDVGFHPLYVQKYQGVSDMPAGIGAVNSSYSHEGSVYPANLFADTSSINITVNALRQAFQVQRLLERDARGGSRYWELLKAHFTIVAPDASLQRPEYLGSSRTYINMTQVVQQSSTDATSPQGNTAAFSKTLGKENSFTKSFVEHGMLFCLGCVRTDHTYQQGLAKKWSRKSRYDYFWPELAHIGEQPIMLKEIYYDGSESADDVFGYQEAYADLRYSPSYVTGAFRSNVDGSLDSWHYADYYASRPYLSEDWIKETSDNVDRTLAVSSDLEDQFLADFYFKSVWTRPIPHYGVPGLIDHY